MNAELGAWQCPGCKTYYSPTVKECRCACKLEMPAESVYSYVCKCGVTLPETDRQLHQCPIITTKPEDPRKRYMPGDVIPAFECKKCGAIVLDRDRQSHKCRVGFALSESGDVIPNICPRCNRPLVENGVEHVCISGVRWQSQE